MAAPAKITTETIVGPARAARGEIHFPVTMAGRSRDCWIKVEAPLVPSTDAVVPPVLLAAMTQGARLRLHDPVAAGLSHDLDEIQRYFASGHEHWSSWPRGIPRPIEVVRSERPEPEPENAGAVGAFFSGGIDSLYTALEAPGITHLVFVGGFDTPHDRPDLIAAGRAHTEAAAARLGKRLLVVETNLRDLLWEVAPWDAAYGTLLASVALALSPAFARFYISSGPPDALGEPDGSHARLDHLWGTERLETVRFGGDATRLEKLERVAESPAACESVRVCLDEAEPVHCGRCKKCLRAMVLAELLGIRPRFPTLPAVLDLECAASIDPGHPVPAAYVTEAFDAAVDAREDSELVGAYRWLFRHRAPGRAELDGGGGPARVNLALRGDSDEPALEWAIQALDELAGELGTVRVQPVLFGAGADSGDAPDWLGPFARAGGADRRRLTLSRPLRLHSSTLAGARRRFARAALTLTDSEAVATASRALGVAAHTFGLDREVEPIDGEASELAAAVALLRAEERDLWRELARERERVEELAAAAAAHAEQLASVVRSPSWRITAPLRRVKRVARARRRGRGLY